MGAAGSAGACPMWPQCSHRSSGLGAACVGRDAGAWPGHHPANQALALAGAGPVAAWSLRVASGRGDGSVRRSRPAARRAGWCGCPRRQCWDDRKVGAIARPQDVEGVSAHADRSRSGRRRPLGLVDKPMEMAGEGHHGRGQACARASSWARMVSSRAGSRSHRVRAYADTICLPSRARAWCGNGADARHRAPSDRRMERRRRCAHGTAPPGSAGGGAPCTRGWVAARRGGRQQRGVRDRSKVIVPDRQGQQRRDRGPDPGRTPRRGVGSGCT